MSDADFNRLKRRADAGDRDASIALTDAARSRDEGLGDVGTGRTDDMTTPPAAPKNYDDWYKVARADERNKGVSDAGLSAFYEKSYGGKA
jgi:hypothetical protein